MSSRRNITPNGPVVVGIPVRDEEDRIAGCLEALENQAGARADHIILLLNNCTDRTASVSRRVKRDLITPLHIVEMDLPVDQSNAGYARHLALEAAYGLAGDAGVLLTTDADGRVDPDWLQENLTAIRNGADAVAGWAELDPLDWGSIPLRLHEDDARESAYDALCDELHSRLDPDLADPWPRHTQASGASIAVTAKAYRAAGGMPRIACGEDRAFVAALRRIDAKIRHSPAARVMVSGRIDGRAAGGMADTIRRRLIAPDQYLDDRLERAEDCARRAVLRRLARLAYDGRCPPIAWWNSFGISECVATASLAEPSFGITWATLETLSPRLIKRPVPTAALPREHVIAKELLAQARQDPEECRRALLNRAPAASSATGDFF